MKSFVLTVFAVSVTLAVTTTLASAFDGRYDIASIRINFGKNLSTDERFELGGLVPAYFQVRESFSAVDPEEKPRRNRRAGAIVACVIGGVLLLSYLRDECHRHPAHSGGHTDAQCDHDH